MRAILQSCHTYRTNVKGSKVKSEEAAVLRMKIRKAAAFLLFWAAGQKFCKLLSVCAVKIRQSPTKNTHFPKGCVLCLDKYG